MYQMEQEPIFKNPPQTPPNVEHIGGRLKIRFSKSNPAHATLYNHDMPVRKVDLNDRVDKRLFIVECVELGANQSLLAKILGISRQTIHNYIEIKKHFGREGLVNSYSPSRSKNRQKQRNENQDKLPTGNKARQLEDIRRQQRAEKEEVDNQPSLPFGDLTHTISPESHPFVEEHDWEFTRYAGTFCYLIPLIHLGLLWLIMAAFGGNFAIFLVFVFMCATNTRSIEQLKNINRREAGRILGIGKLPTKNDVRGKLWDACQSNLSDELLSLYFKKQVCTGVVGIWLWFTDGHSLPYSGKSNVHCTYNTQRRLMMPGRTNMVTCDESGRVIDFEIQEGKGDLRDYIVELALRWKEELDDIPVMVFDREGYGADFFITLSKNDIDFVAWEKNVNTTKLNGLEDDKFTERFEFNQKAYGVFEDTKVVRNENKESVSLRRIYIWNITSKRRTCVLSSVDDSKMDTCECAKAILNRWGASENAFKHMQNRHPFNYQPGYAMVKSDKQEIANPEVKRMERQIAQKQKNLNKLYKESAKHKPIYNKDRSPRRNSAYQRAQREIEQAEAEMKDVKEYAKTLPDRIDVSTLEDYEDFDVISNESKNLFDFINASVWNARKEMTDSLLKYFDNKNEYIDLFYAITQCHGWIKVDRGTVRVRLEPLQQPRRRAAQIQFCRSLSDMNVITPGGKQLQIEVGESPSE